MPSERLIVTDEVRRAVDPCDRWHHEPALRQAIIYDLWGNVQTDSTAMMRLNTLRFGFKGMLYDETTGLYNARARWYQPDVGRFMSEDPIGLS